MKTIYGAEYAPAQWKKQYAAYDLNDQFKQSLSIVQSAPQFTYADSRELFKNFIYAMKDYHTSISFTATESAGLPIKVRGAGNQEFIVEVDRTKLSASAFPFDAGDELVTIDGVSAADAVTALQNQIPANVPETDRAIAEMRLFSRSAARGIAVPKGPVTLGLRHKGETAVKEIQLIWNYTSEKIAARGDFLSLPTDLHAIQMALSGSVLGSHLNPQMSVKIFDKNSLQAESPFDLGARQSFIPALGQKLWESAPDSAFYAYLYINADRKLIGYVRIPSYEPDNAMAAVQEFTSLVERFQSSADALVIDQVNNPGGSVFYLYALASTLSDQPLKTPRHRMAINQADVADAIKTIDQLKDVKTDADAVKAFGADGLGGYPVSYEAARFLQANAQFMVDEWTAGRKLTTPFWIAGVDHINPASSHFTKPILLLVNHLDFSGGDFFPTIMQDNKRVTVFGSRTAGAGGYVKDVSIPNNLGIESFRVTESIAERLSGHPIENLGVTPDVAYEITADDIQNGYQGYVKAVQAALKAITP